MNGTSWITIGFALAGIVLFAVGTLLVRNPRFRAEATATGVGSFGRFSLGGLAYIAGWGLCLLGACVFVPVLVMTGANMGRLAGLALLAGAVWVLSAPVQVIRRTRAEGGATPWLVVGLLAVVGLLCGLLGVALLLPY